MRFHRIALLSVLAAAPSGANAQLRLSASGVAQQVEHRVDAGFGVAQSSGMMIGGGGLVGFGPSVEIGVSVTSGTLNADSASADDLDATRGELWAAIYAVRWLALRASTTVHSFTTPIATQRWTTVRVGGEARVPMLDGSFHAIGRLELVPITGVSGSADVSSAIAAAAGIDWRRGWVDAEILYSLERYEFTEVDGIARREQLAFVSARVGVTYTRRR